MTLYETVESIVKQYEKIGDFCKVTTDFGENEEGNLVIANGGNNLIKRDIVGSETLQHDFEVIALNQAITNYDRLQNNNWLLEFADYLQNTKKATFGINGKLCEILKITANKGMILSAPDENSLDVVAYSVPFSVIYKKYENSQYIEK
jgi:hypothetical protein